ncbi:MAG: amidohydrolase [Clostridiaceae bacterium]|nr:amidohydrolase [Clostridiaceae bacterium]
MDIALHNGKIYTGSGFAQAISVKDGIITAVGTNEDILSACKGSLTVDLAGKTVIPGLIDSHLHMFNLGASLLSVQLHGAASITECIERGRKFITANSPEPGSVIIGRGWNDDYFTDEHRMLCRLDLDKISIEHPIILTRACGHALACNTKALTLAGVTCDTPQVDGGEFELGADNLPNGIFKENAMGYIRKLIEFPSLNETKLILQTAMKHASAQGITSVQTNDMHEASRNIIWQAYEELAKEELSTVRSYQQCHFDTLDGFKQFLSEGYKTGYGSEMNKIGPLKLFVDGSLGARTSLMRQDFSDMPGNRGIMCISQEELDAFVALAQQNGMQVAVHAIGDRAIEMTLDAYKKALPAGENPMRHGIVHCQITDMPLLERFANQHISALVQPIFLHYDMHIAADRVGEALASTSYAFGTMDKLGIHTSYGTDAPVEDLKTMENIYCSVTRKDLKGNPEDGWYPKEKVSLSKAIDHYTVDGAYNSFEEYKKGRLLPGYLGDMAVLSRDIFSCEPDSIKDIKIAMTILGGKIVYQA